MSLTECPPDPFPPEPPLPEPPIPEPPFPPSPPGPAEPTNARSTDAAPTTGTQAASHGPRRSSSGFDEVGCVLDLDRLPGRERGGEGCRGLDLAGVDLAAGRERAQRRGDPAAEVGWVPDSVRVLRTETEKTSQEVCRKVLGTRFASFLVPAIGLLSAARSDDVSGTSKKSKLLGTSSRLQLHPREASDLDRT